MTTASATAAPSTNHVRPYDHAGRYPITRDTAGNVLDPTGTIVGSLRGWQHDDTAARTAAIVACFDAIDGRRALPATIGSDPMVTLCMVTAYGCSAAVVLDVSRKLDARLGYDGAAFTLRCRAQRLAADELVTATRVAASAKTAEATALRVTRQTMTTCAASDRRAVVARPRAAAVPMVATVGERYVTLDADDCGEDGSQYDGDDAPRAWGDL